MEIPPALVEKLCSARRVAVLTGAGVSAESGVPTDWTSISTMISLVGFVALAVYLIIVSRRQQGQRDRSRQPTHGRPAHRDTAPADGRTIETSRRSSPAGPTR